MQMMSFVTSYHPTIHYGEHKQKDVLYFSTSFFIIPFCSHGCINKILSFALMISLLSGRFSIFA